MEITKIEITPEDIEKHLKNAVMHSAIGESLKKGISEKLRGWEFDKAVKDVIEKEIPKIICQVMKEPEKFEMITNAVREQLTPEIVRKITNQAIVSIWS